MYVALQSIFRHSETIHFYAFAMEMWHTITSSIRNESLLTAQYPSANSCSMAQQSTVKEMKIS